MASMDVKTRFEALSKSSYLDVLLPKAPDFDAATLIRNGSPDAISKAPARRNLFFDEQACTLVVLKTPRSEDEVREVLPDLELVIAAHATDAVPQGAGNAASASGKHDLKSQSFPARDFADLIALEDQTYVVWKPNLHLARPRARLQRPAIYFTANLTIGSAVQKLPQRPKEQFLKSYEPLPANILEPLQFDPALSDSNIFLSESRITKVSPKAPNLSDVVRPIRGASKRAFPAIPAVFTRIRYSTLPDAIIASLHIETSPLIAGTVKITKAGLEIADAKVEAITNVALPLETRGGDETILLFKLLPLDESKASPTGEPSPVSISIRADASLDQGSEISFDIDWQANVDLSHTWQKLTYRWSRPITTSSHQKSLSIQSIPKASIETSRTSGEVTGEGVTFNFTAEPTTHVSAEFKLNVHCNNRSTRARRFGLVMLQPRKAKASVLPHQSFNTATLSTDTVADVFNLPPLERVRSPDVLDLNPDARIGPLPPGACFETHLKFKALRSGMLDLGTLRIVDLDTRQTVDVRELPDVVALDAVVDS